MGSGVRCIARFLTLPHYLASTISQPRMALSCLAAGGHFYVRDWFGFIPLHGASWHRNAHRCRGRSLAQSSHELKVHTPDFLWLDDSSTLGAGGVEAGEDFLQINLSCGMAWPIIAITGGSVSWGETDPCSNRIQRRYAPQMICSRTCRTLELGIQGSGEETNSRSEEEEEETQIIGRSEECKSALSTPRPLSVNDQTKVKEIIKELENRHVREECPRCGTREWLVEPLAFL